jgi:hypothetical protein
LSPFLLQELERVFSYERVRTSTKLTDEEVAEYLGVHHEHAHGQANAKSHRTG